MNRAVMTTLVLGLIVGLGQRVEAETVTWQVATVHGEQEFSISPDASTLTYDLQPQAHENEWYWFENNGSASNILATHGGVTPASGPINHPDGITADPVRAGCRTFAMTNVAAGYALDNIKLEYTYDNRLGASAYPTTNFFMTDGAGHFGILSPASGGIGALSTSVVNGDWTTITFDLTNPAIPDDASVAVYEHNGLTDQYGDPFTTMTWGGATGIKHLTIAGMYDYQRSPTNGWEAWGTMFEPVNTAGNSAIVNGYGIALIWGDTVGHDAYITQQRIIMDPTVTLGATEYVGTFADATAFAAPAPIPEPITILSLLGGLGGLGVYMRRRRAA